ncbi:hypothetical protein KGM_202594 [Danaus plexippus plexippus]|uniref:Uncharacterized protein n=1 Tax=Danaus plexippus plexippus TaxID=278856 RepID=A0A212FJR9_DANPL|nr:hypothetical protein KGM_202594 [Danaus plexippus plexippus]
MSKGCSGIRYGVINRPALEGRRRVSPEGALSKRLSLLPPLLNEPRGPRASFALRILKKESNVYVMPVIFALI